MEFLPATMEQHAFIPWKASFRHQSKRPTGQDLIPYIQASTVPVLSLLFMLWRNDRPRIQRALDLSVCAACFAFNRVHQPLMALGLAVGYTICTAVPGSYASLSLLPSHAVFMRELEIIQSSDDNDEEGHCPVCYDHEYPLARLPCDHTCCVRCLKLMAKSYLTTCPQCRRPLFSVNDRMVYILSKGALACMGVNVALLLFISLQEIRTSQYGNAVISFGSICLYLPFLWFYCFLIWKHGDNWWR